MHTQKNKLGGIAREGEEGRRPIRNQKWHVGLRKKGPFLSLWIRKREKREEKKTI